MDNNFIPVVNTVPVVNISPADNGAPLIGGRPLSPVHYSPNYGVHADIGTGDTKEHVPFQGQTTLQTFRIAGKPSYANDVLLAKYGGSYKAND